MVRACVWTGWGRVEWQCVCMCVCVREREGGYWADTDRKCAFHVYLSSMSRSLNVRTFTSSNTAGRHGAKHQTSSRRTGNCSNLGERSHLRDLRLLLKGLYSHHRNSRVIGACDAHVLIKVGSSHFGKEKYLFSSLRQSKTACRWILGSFHWYIQGVERKSGEMSRR